MQDREQFAIDTHGCAFSMACGGAGGGEAEEEEECEGENTLDGAAVVEASPAKTLRVHQLP